MNKIGTAGIGAFTQLITLIKTTLGGKVDKADGKGLSSNDFTTEEKAKLAGLSEGANKTVIVDSLTSTDAGSALSANQGKVLDEKIAAINTDLAGKGSGDMAKATYDTDGDGVVDNAAKLGGQAPGYYAVAADVPTKVSDLTNDSGFQTADQVTAAIDGKGYQTADQVTATVNAKVSSTYKAGGSTAFAGLPAADEAHLGMVYNVTDAFTTTDAFMDGAGKTYPAGTNVVIVASAAGGMPAACGALNLPEGKPDVSKLEGNLTLTVDGNDISINFSKDDRVCKTAEDLAGLIQEKVAAQDPDTTLEVKPFTIPGSGTKIALRPTTAVFKSADGTIGTALGIGTSGPSAGMSSIVDPSSFYEEGTPDAKEYLSDKTITVDLNGQKEDIQLDVSGDGPLSADALVERIQGQLTEKFGGKVSVDKATRNVDGKVEEYLNFTTTEDNNALRVFSKDAKAAEMLGLDTGDGYKYDVLSGFVDLSGYVASTDLQEMTADEVTALWNGVTA